LNLRESAAAKHDNDAKHSPRPMPVQRIVSSVKRASTQVAAA
jgi:hypothetical protein